MSDEPKSRVLLVDDALVIRGILTGILKNDFDIVGDAGNGREALELVEQLKPDLVVMDVTMPEMDGIEATRQITERFPGVEVVILSAVTSESSIKAGLAAGARDYLAKPPKPPEILEILHRLARQQRERRQTVSDGGGLPGRGIWTFCSALGADGRTTFLLSLANELLTMGRKVVVVDADLLFGDVGFYLDIESSDWSYSKLLDPEETLDETNLKSALVQHAAGFSVLANPPLAEPIFEAPAGRLVKLMHLLVRDFEYVLVDMPAGIPDGLLPLLDDSRYIFPVSRGLPEKLKNFRNMIKTLKLCGFEPPRLCPVLTQTDEEAAGKFVKGFGLEVRGYFPSDREAVAEATKAAQPVTRVAPRSAYTQRVREFVTSVLEIPPAAADAPAKKPSLMERLRGKT